LLYAISFFNAVIILFVNTYAEFEVITEELNPLIISHMLKVISNSPPGITLLIFRRIPKVSTLGIAVVPKLTNYLLSGRSNNKKIVPTASTTVAAITAVR
jgi:hypothetical protein